MSSIRIAEFKGDSCVNAKKNSDSFAVGLCQNSFATGRSVVKEGAT